VCVGESSLIGANAVIKPGVIIGSNVTIGAGSVVLRDIPDGETWAGNPARKIK
jgi:acetyltransferase-like isoleucine patch superfamily enzyme